MNETTVETDYLVVGSGAVGMAFTDSLVHETDDRLVVVDGHHGPGGHWNDAYPFVRLHQPSAYYGLNSMVLGGDGLDADPLNPGMNERASSAQIIDYYERAMAAMLATGRVSYRPMSVHAVHEDGTHRITSKLSGITTRVQVRKKMVDTTYLHTAVPSTHPPKYTVTEGVTCVPVNELSRVRTPPLGFVVVGAGKTGIDACLWLLGQGVPPDRITWIMPRDSWFQNRANVQSGAEFLLDTFGALATQMESIAEAGSLPDLLSRLESTGQLLRLDPTVEPRMYHAAVVSEAELEALRTIRQVVRLGRVQRIEPHRIVLAEGSVPAEPGALYVDCSASAAELRPSVPVFGANTIIPQFVRAFQPTFSAAMIGYVEAHYADESVKNEICGVVPLPDTPLSWLTMQAAGVLNQHRWSREPDLLQWVAGSRLDGFTAMSRAVNPDDHDKVAVIRRFRSAAKAAGARLPALLVTASTTERTL
ncbi:MAG: pyridine nucleotide-disulfide oxidoreductase [Nocardioidaceae bacterium]